jgi:hypothetical protein
MLQAVAMAAPGTPEMLSIAKVPRCHRWFKGVKMMRICCMRRGARRGSGPGLVLS